MTRKWGIQWKQGDYIRLGKAVSDFNKKINRLEQEEKKLYLPLLVDYNETKKNIKTRSELNRVINSLKRFQKEGAEDIHVFESGEIVTEWEYKELKNLQQTATRNLRKEIESIRMEGQPYITTEERTLRATLSNIRNLNTATGSEFRRIKQRINIVGSSDYEYKKALIWKENYLNTISRYSNYKGYDKLMKLLSHYENPISFYNLFKDNTDTIIEDYLFYISDQMIGQRHFNQLLSELGIEVDDTM